jgi:hypothetical protein
LELLRSDGVIVVVDAELAAGGDPGAIVEVQPEPGREFVRLSEHQDTALALDSAGVIWNIPTSVAHAWAWLPRVPRGGKRYVDVVGGAMFGPYALRSDGVVVELGSTIVPDRRVWWPDGLVPVGFGQDSQYPVVFTKDGSAVALEAQNFMERPAKPRIVPMLGAGWRIVAAAGSDNTAILGAVATTAKGKRPSAVFDPWKPAGYGSTEEVFGWGTANLRLGVTGGGDMRGGVVVVKYEGREIGRAKVTAKTGYVWVPLTVSALKLGSIAVTAQFLGTKTTKKSNRTAITLIHRHTRPK